ncbi:MAG: hypothetical protein R2748_34270 [Bryobacterales bacterium]
MSSVATGRRLAAAFCLGLIACGPNLTGRADAERLSLEVAEGALGDCEALARFVDLAGSAGLDGLLEGLNQFIPRAKVNYPLGLPIGLTGVGNPVKLEGTISGYRAEYRKGHEPHRLLGTPTTKRTILRRTSSWERACPVSSP